MAELSKERLERYLSALFHAPATVTAMTSLRESTASGAAKQYGYGKPVKIEFTVDGKPHAAVLGTASPGPFGHEHMADRAQMVLWDYGAYNSLPNHARALDVGTLDVEGNLPSVANAEEFFLLVEHVEGTGYIHDIARLQDGGELAGARHRPGERAVRLPLDDPPGEGRQPRPVRPQDPRAGRPRRVHHGDGGQLPRRQRVHHLRASSRRSSGAASPGAGGSRGAPTGSARCTATSTPSTSSSAKGPTSACSTGRAGNGASRRTTSTALTANYLFASLQAHGRLADPFETLFQRFWERYIGRTGDEEILEVVAPFYAFRCLVMASPVWYPSLPEDVRRKLFSFTVSLLHAPRFDPARVNEHIRGTLSGRPAFAVWLTGLSSSGKSTIARELAAQLSARGVRGRGPRVRRGPARDHAEGRRTGRRSATSFYAALAYMARLLVEHGVPVIVDATANRRAYRDKARQGDPPLRRGARPLPAGGVPVARPEGDLPARRRRDGAQRPGAVRAVRGAARRRRWSWTGSATRRRNRRPADRGDAGGEGVPAAGYRRGARAPRRTS